MEGTAMKIAFCDDDRTIVESLWTMVEEFFTARKLPAPNFTEFSSGKKLLESKELCDLLFLDVEMPEVNGIFVGRTLKEKYPHLIIIMVTSHIEYLDDAMRFHVFRYLFKPIDKPRLERNLEDALELFRTLASEIAVETKDGVHHVLSSDIICVEATGHKVIVHTAFEEHTSIHSIDYWRTQLPTHCFFQTHRSYIVNMAHVAHFDKTLVYLNHCKVRAFLTRRKYVEFKNAYLLYLESMR